jgi:hypothetical protein
MFIIIFRESHDGGSAEGIKIQIFIVRVDRGRLKLFGFLNRLPTGLGAGTLSAGMGMNSQCLPVRAANANGIRQA